MGALSNVFANMVFWLGLGVAAWSATAVSRRRFLYFFGLRRGAETLTVYLSNLWSQETSSRPVGYSISMHEFKAAQCVGRLFGDAPLRLPEMVRGLIDEVWIRRVVQPNVEVSSIDPTQVSFSNSALVIGSATRNSVRAAFVDNGLPVMVFDAEHRGVRSYRSAGQNRGVKISRGARRGQAVPDDLNLAVLEKIYDSDRGVTVFFCIGARGDTSWAVTEYLVRNWAPLLREFGDQNFALCLGFPAGDSYLEHYVEPRRLVTIPG